MKLLILLLTISMNANAESLSTKLDVLGVNQTKMNQASSGYMNNYYSCGNFKGTYAGNSISLKPVARGGSGRYKHRIVYLLGEGYTHSQGDSNQKDINVKNGYFIKLKLPNLRDDISFIQQSIMLITEDVRSGKTVTKSIMFNVTRPVVLKKTNNPRFLENECQQVYSAYQSPIGVLSNGSTNPSTLSIKQGIDKLWTSLSGAQWGIYFSPLAWTGLGNILSFNKSYFTQFSKQVSERVEINSQYVLSPGDYAQIYEQRTRHVTAFDASRVSVCGHSELVDEEYMVQWWAVAYHAVPINPFSEDSVPTEAVGAYPRNTCSDQYTPEFSNSDINFVRTN